MPEWFILVIAGVVFVVLGIIGIIWGIREEKRLFEKLATQHDLREFTLRHVESPQPGALKLGGWIAIALGALMVVAGVVFWYTGWPPD